MHGILLEMHYQLVLNVLISSSTGNGNSRNKFEILANLDEDCSSTLVSFPHLDPSSLEWKYDLRSN